MTDIKWPSGRTTGAFEKEVLAVADKVLGGSIIAIDPASRQAGWARYQAGKLVGSGVISLPNGPIQQRLQVLYDTLFAKEKPDILAIEKIRGHGGHIYLTWAVGVCTAAVRAPVLLEIATTHWKAVAKTVPTYVKSDRQDAEMIGLSLIKLAQHLKGKS